MLNSTQSSATKPSSTTRPTAKIALIVVIVVAVVVTGTLLSLLAVSTFVTDSKTVPSYAASISQDPINPTSMTVHNVNGRVLLTTWSQSSVMINGTITARGYGTSADRITFDRSTSSGMISFTVVYPTMMGAFGDYTVDLNVYIPSAANLGTVQVTTTNGDIKTSGLNATVTTLTTTNGAIVASNIDTDSLTLSSTNGNVEFNCTSSCNNVKATTTNGGVTGTLSSVSDTGNYELTTTNGSVKLTVPKTSSFELSAQTTNGNISTTGLGLNVQTSKSLVATVGHGGPSVHLTTTNGSINIDGV